MRRTIIGIFSVSLVISGIAAVASERPASADLSTQRRVQGVITAVDPAAVTITPLHAKSGVSGAVDPKRTRVTLNGRPARASDLQVSFSAKGEMGLDDVWVSIQAESR